MEGLYQSPPYSYLPQQQQQQQQHTDHLYRSNSYTHHAHHSMNHWSPPLPVSSPSTGAGGNPSHSHAYHYYTNTNPSPPSARPKITTNIWEDEGTLCFQVDAKGVCVARRQDNDMINGTKLLNVVGMSRGKRDGILKNEKGRVVVKVGAMHLKGVWIPFSRATELAEKFKILDVLYPLFVEEPSVYLCNPIGNGQSVNGEVIPSVTNKCNMVSSPLPPFNNNNSHRTQQEEYSPSIPNWDSRPSYLNSHYDHHHPLNRVHQHSTDESDMYLFNGHTNRGSFSSVSSHQSYLYPVHQQHNEEERESVTTPTSYVDQIYHHTLTNRSFDSNKYTSSPYIKSSPYTNHHINTTTTTTTTNPRVGILPPPPPSTATSNTTTTAATSGAAVTTTTAAVTSGVTTSDGRSVTGSTTPSSWFSPETPTAVLFGKEDMVTGLKRRKTSTCSLDSRVTRRLKIEQD